MLTTFLHGEDELFVKVEFSRHFQLARSKTDLSDDIVTQFRNVSGLQYNCTLVFC